VARARVLSIEAGGFVEQALGSRSTRCSMTSSGRIILALALAREGRSLNRFFFGSTEGLRFSEL